METLHNMKAVFQRRLAQMHVSLAAAAVFLACVVPCALAVTCAKYVEDLGHRLDSGVVVKLSNSDAVRRWEKFEKGRPREGPNAYLRGWQYPFKFNQTVCVYGVSNLKALGASNTIFIQFDKHVKFYYWFPSIIRLTFELKSGIWRYAK